MPQTRTHISRKRSLQVPLPMPDVLWKAMEHPEIVHIPARTVVAVDGQGEPEGARFQRSVKALYDLGYTLKFARKAKGAGDFRIAPLEARWWADEPGELINAPRAHWKWQLRIAVPADLTEAELLEGIAEVRRKKSDGEEVSRAHLATLPPQTVGRALHIGPYPEEGRTFSAIRAVLADRHVEAAPRHIEIYLGDPRRTAPDKLRTVLCVETKISS